MKLPKSLLLLALLALAGCASSGVIQTSADTYKISKKSAGGAFANQQALQDSVLQEANAFAASKGKVAVQVASNFHAPAVGGFPSFEYYFRLEDPHGSAPQMGGGAKRDVYAELTKLDDLRKRGIITEAEFAAQKQKLLSAP